MIYLKSLAACAMALTLAGCAALPTDISFHGEPGKGFLIIAAEGSPANFDGRFILELQRLNAAKDGFVEPQVLAYFGGKSDFPNDEFVKPKSTSPAIRLTGVRLAPGDYAIVSYFSSNGALGTYTSCYSLGTGVYHIKEGVVNLIHYRAGKGPSSLDLDTVSKDVAATLKGYPNITAPVEMAVPIGNISFATSTNILGNPQCEPDGPLSFKPLPQSSAAKEI